jgi:hypothetical protein
VTGLPSIDIDVTPSAKAGTHTGNSGRTNQHGG